MFEGVAAPQQQHRAAVCDHGKRSNRQAPFAALLVGFASAACSGSMTWLEFRAWGTWIHSTKVVSKRHIKGPSNQSGNSEPISSEEFELNTEADEGSLRTQGDVSL
jgi:hypothetical protein